MQHTVELNVFLLPRWTRISKEDHQGIATCFIGFPKPNILVRTLFLSIAKDGLNALVEYRL